MTETEAAAQVAAMLGMADLPADDLTRALAASAIPDAAGVWPGQPGYVPTWDLEWAAATVCDQQAVKAALQGTGGQVTQVSSEGTTITKTAATAPDWAGVAAWWRRKSRTIGPAITGGVLGVIEVHGADPMQTVRPDPWDGWWPCD